MRSPGCLNWQPGFCDVVVLLGAAELDHYLTHGPVCRRRYVHELSNGTGVNFKLTASGEEAMTLLANGGYKALVADIRLAGAIDGWALARQARTIDPAFPIIYTTAVAGGEWPVQGVPNSVLLQKPFATSKLVAPLSHILYAGSLPA